MPDTKVLAPLLPVLADLIAWLKAEEVAGVAELRRAVKLQAEKGWVMLASVVAAESAYLDARRQSEAHRCYSR